MLIMEKENEMSSGMAKLFGGVFGEKKNGIKYGKDKNSEVQKGERKKE